MSLATAFKDSKLTEDEQLLKDAGVYDAYGNVSSEGWELLKTMLFEANKKEIVYVVKELKKKSACPVRLEEDDE